LVVQNEGLVSRVLTSRIGVERATQRLERKSDFAGTSPFGSLEDEMLEKVAYTAELLRLMGGTLPHPDTHGRRPHTGNPLGDNTNAVVQ
jgi:hypothetical protein